MTYSEREREFNVNSRSCSLKIACENWLEKFVDSSVTWPRVIVFAEIWHLDSADLQYTHMPNVAGFQFVQ